MAIEIAFSVELQHGRVKGAVYDDEFVFLIPCRLHAIQSRATRVHNQRNNRHFVTQTL